MKKPLLIISMLLLCGCAKTEQSVFVTETEQYPTSESESVSDLVCTDDSVSDITGFDLVEHLSKSSPLIQYYEITEDTVLLSYIEKADYRNEILDLRTGSILAEMHTLNVPNCQQDGFWGFEPGDIYQFSDDEFGRLSAGSIIVFSYSGDMLRRRQIDCDFSTGCLTYSISSDTVYYDALDLNSPEKRYSICQKSGDNEAECLLSVPYPSTNALAMVVSMQEKSGILYLRGLQSVNPTGSKTVSCYGMLNLHTHQLQSRTVTNGDADIQYYSSGAFVCEENVPYNIQPSGCVYWMQDGVITEHNLTYPQECISASVSQSGKYYATQMESLDQEGNQIIRLTVYDSQGLKQKATDMTFKESDSHHVEALFISETGRRLFCRMIQQNGKSVWYSWEF